MLPNIVDAVKCKLTSGEDSSDSALHEQKFWDLQKHAISNERKMDIFVVVPNSYDKSKDVAGEFLAGKVVVVNFVKLSLEEKQRMFDYLNGVAYTVNADIKQVTQNTIVYIPSEFVATKMRI